LKYNRRDAESAEGAPRKDRFPHPFSAGGHAYWSPDVAQHHQYRGEGNIDQERLEQRQAEAQLVAMLVEDLRTFEDSGSFE
jgi:hypothetical protein